MDFKFVEMTEENKKALADRFMYDVASRGSTQEEVARDGFPGVNNMSQEQFNYYCFHYDVDQ